jgi:malic enzyme
VALAVLDKAVEEGVAQAEVPKTKEERRSWAEKRRWEPKYPELQFDKNGFD